MTIPDDVILALIDQVNDIEVELGLNPGGVYSDVRVRLDILESRINNPFSPSPNVPNPFTIGNDGITISTGAGFPTEDRLPGSLYLRTDGYVDEGVYARRPDGYWHQVAGGGGGGGSQTLAQTLVLGNNTGGTNIQIDSTDSITSASNGGTILIKTADATTNDAGDVTIQGGANTNSGHFGGSVILFGGAGDTVGGNVNLIMGNAGLGGQGGGSIIAAGAANNGADGQGCTAEFDGGSDQNGGSITFTGGNASATGTSAGNVILLGGSASTGQGGSIVITPGTGATAGTLQVNGDTNISGKLTVSGLIDPVGLVLDQQASVPFTPAVSTKGTLWIKNNSPNALVFTDGSGTDNILRSTTDVNVLDFGADNTGVSAAQSAINSAISAVASTGGRVIIPKGTYLITGQITMSNDKTSLILSRGAKLKKSGTNFNMIRITANHCSVEGGEIDGNSQAQGSGILINGAHNLVRDGYIHHVGDVTDSGAYVNGSHGICLDGNSSTCSLNRIESTVILSCHDIGISHSLATDSIISDVEIGSNGLEGMTFDNASHKCRVSQARLYGNCVNGGAGGISIDGSDLGTLIGCYVSSSNATPGIITNNNLGNSNYWSVTGGQYIGNGTYGIYLKNNAGNTGSWWTITANVVRDGGSGSIKLDSGSNNNKVVANSLNGVAVSDSGTGNTITASS